MLRRFWPEQRKEAEELAAAEKKLLAMEYDAFTDCDSLVAVTPEEYARISAEHKANIYSGWIAVIADYTGGNTDD